MNLPLLKQCVPLNTVPFGQEQFPNSLHVMLYRQSPFVVHSDIVSKIDRNNITNRSTCRVWNIMP